MLEILRRLTLIHLRKLKKTRLNIRSKKSPDKNSPVGIKPFVCLKGRFHREKGSPKSLKFKEGDATKVKVKERINNFESIAKNSEVPKCKSNKNTMDLKDIKIKRIVELFESEEASKVVQAPKNVEIDGASGVIGDAFRVKDAFKLLMDSRGDARKKTPGKVHRRSRNSSTRKEKASSKKISK